MATVYSGYYTTGTYTKTRVKVDYSGTSATATLLYTRTNTYSGASGQIGTFTFGGVAVNYEKYFYGQQTDAVVASVNFTISTQGGTYSGTSTSTGQNHLLDFSGSVTIPSQGTPPSGLSVAMTGRTWNSVDVAVSYSSLGTGTFQYTEGKVFSSDSTGYWASEGICKGRWAQYATAGAHTFTLSNSSQPEGSGGISVRGCLAFKVGGGVFTSVGNAHAIMGTVYYLPPAPLATLSKSEAPSEVGNNVYHTITIIGGNSTNNEDVTVTTEYRYSTDGGANYTAWTSAGTGKPWDTKTVSFNSHYGEPIKVEARQVYQSQYSDVKTLSYTANQGTSPGDPVVTNFTPLVNGATATVTTSSYGQPSSVDGRYVELGIGPANGGNLWHYSPVPNVLSATITTTEASAVYPSGSLPIYPNTQYAYRALASNQVIWNFGSWVNFITLPATPSACSLTVTGATTATLIITSPSQGNAATMTAYYKLNSGSWVNAGTIASDGTVTVNLTGLTSGGTYTATAKITNSSGDSGTITSSAITTYKAPNTPTVTNFVPLVNGGKATVSVSSYGVPASASGRYIELEVGPAGGGTPYRFFTVGNTSTQNNITVNNSSAVWPSGGHITINPNTKYAYRGYANNTILFSTNNWVDFITLPATPTATSVSDGATSGKVTINAPAQGTASTLTAYYKVGTGDWVSAGTVAQGGSVTASITGLASNTTYTVTVKLTNSSGDSGTATTSFTTARAMYGSVGGRTKTISKMYGSVGGETKRIVKFYGSVGTDLMNRATCTENVGLTWANGTTYSLTNGLATAQISVSAGDKIDTNFICAAMFYDSGGTYLGALQLSGTIAKSSGATQRSFTVPSGYSIASMRLAFRPADNGNVSMLDKTITILSGKTKRIF